MTRTSTLSCISSATKLEILARSSFRVAILNQDIFSLGVTKISQPLPKFIGVRIGCGWSNYIPSRENAYQGNFLWLLRLSGRSKTRRIESIEQDEKTFLLLGFPIENPRIKNRQ